MGRFDRPFTFDRVIRIIIIVLVAFGLFYFVKSVRNALLPFCIAWLFAYMINPIVQWVQMKLKLKGKLLPILIVLLVIASVVAGALWLLIPSMIEESRKLFAAANSFFNNHHYVETVPLAWQQYLAENWDVKRMLSELSAQDMQSIVTGLLKGVWGIVSDSWALLIGMLSFFFMLIYLVFILLDYERISEGAIGLVPNRYRVSFMSVLDDVKGAMSKYFRGQALIAGTVGILLAIGFEIIDLPLGILLGLFMGVLNMVPYLQLIGIVPMLFLCLLKCVETGGNFWIIVALAVAVMVIVQLIQDLVLTPKIMGRIMSLNPAIILLSLSVWGSLLGVLGMIIALPLTTLLLAYYRRFIANFDA